MHWKGLDPDEYFADLSAHALIDVRSEREFAKGHLPGAINIPLLNDELRHEIGILYKQQGRSSAVLRGFEQVGPQFHRLIQTVLEHAGTLPVSVYCWRGGMRSNIMAWLLSMAGLRVNLLKGGYKSCRTHLTSQFAKPANLFILGGKTGSGKTDVLHALQRKGVQVLDLEGLASHKGSAFGHLGMAAQPTQEQFENFIGYHLQHIDPTRPLVLENESRMIGRLIIPPALFDAMRSSPLIEIEVERSERFQRLFKEYCHFPVEQLIENTLRVQKRLGPQHAKRAVDLLTANERSAWLDILLDYYDKTYSHSRAERAPESIRSIPFRWSESEISIEYLSKQFV